MAPIKHKVILHLTSLSSGGGGSITLAIHKQCLDFGFDSYVVVRGRKCICPDGSCKEIKRRRKFFWNRLRRFAFRQVVKHAYIDERYSMYNLCERFTCYSAKDILAVLPQNPDVIFVHWVSDFANAEVIHDLEKLTGAKIVFLLVDHALYSGGCHYQLDCQGFIDGCHNCPATTSKFVQKGIEKNYAFKKHYIPKDVFVTARAIENQRLRKSEIYKDCHLELVVFPVDENKYCPSSNRDLLRAKWGVPIDGKVLLMGATQLGEARKGIGLLIKALPLVKEERLVVLVAGNMNRPMDLDKNVIMMGFLNERQLIEAYQMADVFVCPTLADSGPLMVKQACLCGVPVVAFPVGVSVELVENEETGYLAKYGDVEDLARGMQEILSLPKNKWNEMSERCRNRALGLFSNQVKGCTIYDMIYGMFKDE